MIRALISKLALSASNFRVLYWGFVKTSLILIGFDWFARQIWLRQEEEQVTAFSFLPVSGVLQCVHCFVLSTDNSPFEFGDGVGRGLVFGGQYLRQTTKSPTCADRLGFLLGVNVRRRADSMSYRLWSARMGLVGIKATNLKRQHFLSPLVSSIWEHLSFCQAYAHVYCKIFL